MSQSRLLLDDINSLDLSAYLQIYQWFFQFFHGISMAFFLGSFLHFLLIPWTLAGPASMGSLTPTLAQVIPPCAQECLVSFITTNFPSSSCGTPPDSDCLCISSSASGLTIGEGGLECLYSECPDYDFDNSIALQVYEVCATVQGAKPNTHSTLTATSTTIVSATGGVRATLTNSNNFSYNSDSGSVFPGASSAALGTNTIIATATGSPSPFPKSTSSLDYARTTKVASGGVGLNVTPTTTSTSSTIGWSFGGDKIIDSQETTPDMAAIGGGEFENHPQPSSPPAVVAAPPPRRELRIVTPASSSDDGWNRYQRSMDPEEEIALAVHPPPSKSSNHSPIDPVTPASHRTSSQLLPDKPIYSLFPPPLRVTPRNSSAPAGLRPSGPTAPRQANPPHGKYSPRFPSNMDTSQAHLQPGSSRQRSLSDPFYDDFNRSPPPNIYPYVQASRPRSPGSSRPVPRNFPGAWTTPIDIVRKPVPAQQSPSARGLRPAPSRTQQPSLPKPYPPPPPPIEQHYLAAIERSHSRKDPRRKQSNSSSKLTRFSNGSETSFEDADEDEAPAARKFLSPVAESPALRSPHRSGVTYPSIPISAAESPTRTAQKRAPARPELPTRSDSLLSKRLGPQKAREIAGRLQGTHPGVDEDVRDTAKWKILVSPGLNHLESSGSPRSARGNGRTPPMNM
ncbi:hypothetical protein HO133_002166 [Letharia lupina]|uniref:CFEM domain-containing protein n=1 Tax=Letharia lupina TaxID=560253 RepID=A0A8H6CDK6_9LECA|nr:uncharacterized protein HO133_002166 [Letharia lupina]KAF6221311.1 hypothetical protein HO133_002166 [Letharia lupina]